MQPQQFTSIPPSDGPKPSLRRLIRARISKWLARRRGTDQPIVAALDRPLEHILVIRLNKRLGNTLFVTPLLRTLADTFPHARIDVLIRDADKKALLTNLPGIGRVWVLPKGLLPLLALMRKVRQENYDLAIDPTTHSASNRFAMLLCRARQRMGFVRDDQWLRLTHAAVEPEQEPHQARQAVWLLAQSVSGLRVIAQDRLEVRPTRGAIETANRHWQTVWANEVPTGPVVGFFNLASKAKALPADWWRQWLAALRMAIPNVSVVQLLAPGESETLEPGLARLQIQELDVLAAAIAKLDLFVAADCGPMHLAAAAGTPVIGLFRSTDPRSYAPLGQNCQAVTGADLAPKTTAQGAEALLREKLQVGAD